MEALQTQKLVWGGERRGRRKGGRKDVESRRLGGVGGRWAAPLPAHVFMPSGLRPSYEPRGSFHTQTPSFSRGPRHPHAACLAFLHHPHCPCFLLSCLPALVPVPPSCPQSRERVGTESGTLILLPSTPSAASQGILEDPAVPVFNKYLLSTCCVPGPLQGPGGTRVTRADPDFALSHQLAAVLVGGGKGSTRVGPEVAEASPGPAYLRLLVPVASTSL